MLLCCGAALASITLCQTGLGQDAGLYDKEVDPSKAYVRVLLEDGEQASIGGAPAGLADEQVSGYVSVAAGSVAIGFGDAITDLPVEAGTYYTFARVSDAVIQFTDPAIADPSKAEILFYNLTSRADVDLFVPAAKTDAITGVDAGASQSVELRAPLDLTFEAHVDGTAIASVANVALERKQAVSLFLVDDVAGPTLFQIVNSFAEPR